MTEHLSEQDVDEMLLGTGSTDSERHVAGCGLCRAKIDEFRATMALFNEASLGWAEAKSNTLSRELPLRRAGWLGTPGSSVSLAAALLVAVGLAWSSGAHRFLEAGSALHQASDPAAVRDVARDSAAAADTAGEIANDNAILRDIDSALYKPVPSPTDLYRDVTLESRDDAGQARD